MDLEGLEQDAEGVRGRYTTANEGRRKSSKAPGCWVVTGHIARFGTNWECRSGERNTRKSFCWRI